MNHPSRRRLLAATGAAAASFSLAGCSGGGGDEPTDTQTTLPPTDTTTDQGTTTQDTGGSGEPVGTDQLRQWIPVMDAFEFDVQAAVFYDGDMSAVREQRDAFYEGVYDRIGRTLLGPRLAGIVPAESRERVVQIATAVTVIVETSMGNDELGTALTDAGLSEAEGVGDAAVYEGDLDGTASTTAVVDGVLVQSFGSNARSSVEAVLGARSGETARLLPNDGEVRTLAEGIGESDLLVVSERGEDTPSGDPSLDGATALGYGWRFGAETTDFTLGVTYAEGEVGDASAVTSYFSEQSGVSDYGNLQGSVSGRTVLVTGDIPTDEFDLLSDGTPGQSSGGSGEVPQVQFAFEFDAGTMTVTHEGGDVVQASNLSLVVGNGPAGTQFDDEYDQVSAGDSISVDVSNADSGAQVALIWSDGSSSGILAQTQVP